MSRNKDNSKRQIEEIRLLKKRVRSLERENAKLKKDIQSGRAFPMPLEPETETPAEKDAVDKDTENMVKCKCGKPANLVKLNKRGVTHDYIFCPSCGRREPVRK